MREINQRRMRYFYEVFEQRSIRRAADQLNTSASVLARQIRLLEAEIGQPLFERLPRGMSPTEAARHLRDYWRGCSAQQEILQARLEALSALRVGVVDVAISEGYVEPIVKHVLTEFCGQFPGVTVTLDVRPVNEIVTAVAEGATHMGIAFAPPRHPEVERHASVRQPVVAVMRTGHPLSIRKRSVTFKELAAYPMAQMPPAFGLGQMLDMIANTEKVAVNASLISNSLAAITLFATKGDGICLLGEDPAAAILRSGESVAVPVRHPLLRLAQCHILLKRGRPLPPAPEAFLGWVKNKMPPFATAPLKAASRGGAERAGDAAKRSKP